MIPDMAYVVIQVIQLPEAHGAVVHSWRDDDGFAPAGPIPLHEPGLCHTRVDLWTGGPEKIPQALGQREDQPLVLLRLLVAIVAVGLEQVHLPFFPGGVGPVR